MILLVLVVALMLSRVLGAVSSGVSVPATLGGSERAVGRFGSPSCLRASKSLRFVFAVER